MKIKAVLTVMPILIALGVAVIPQETVSRAHPSTVASLSLTPTKADHGDDASTSATDVSGLEDATDRIIIRYRHTTAGLFSPAQDEQMQRLSQHAGITLTYLREMSGRARYTSPTKTPSGTGRADCETVDSSAGSGVCRARLHFSPYLDAERSTVLVAVALLREYRWHQRSGGVGYNHRLKRDCRRHSRYRRHRSP